MSTVGREIETANSGVLVPLKYERGVSVRVPIGHQLMEDASQHRLRARLHAASRRGELEVVSGWRVARSGAAAVVVKPIREPRSPVPWWIAGTATALSALAGVGIMLYQTRYIWMALAGVLLVVFGIARLLGNHSGGCVGIHCSGCRG